MSELVIVIRGNAKDSARVVPPIASLLRLAEEMQAELEAGRLRSEIAKRHGMSRPRVTQLLNLLRLHPAILDHLRRLRPGTPARFITEHRLRSLVPLPAEKQLERAARTIPGFERRRS